MKQEILEKTKGFLVIAEDLFNKAKLNLIEEKLANKFEDDFHAYYSQTIILNELDEISQLEFKKYFATKLSRWTKQSADIYRFMRQDQALKLINPRRDFLENLLERHMVSPTNGGLIPADKPFKARELLRSIVLNSSSEVSLIDAYLHPNIFTLLSEILEVKPNLKIRLLTHSTKNSNLNNLESNLKIFISEYPSSITESKKEQNTPHDRYIIIDGTRLFHFGHSFHDLGKNRTSSWTEKIEINEVSSTIKVINDSFSNGSTII